MCATHRSVFTHTCMHAQTHTLRIKVSSVGVIQIPSFPAWQTYRLMANLQKINSENGSDMRGNYKLKKISINKCQDFPSSPTKASEQIKSHNQETFNWMVILNADLHSFEFTEMIPPVVKSLVLCLDKTERHGRNYWIDKQTTIIIHTSISCFLFFSLTAFNSLLTASLCSSMSCTCFCSKQCSISSFSSWNLSCNYNEMICRLFISACSSPDCS